MRRFSLSAFGFSFCAKAMGRIMMKLTLLAAALVVVSSGSMQGQGAKVKSALKQKIKRLEQAQVDALLRSDLEVRAGFRSLRG